MPRHYSAQLLLLVLLVGCKAPGLRAEAEAEAGNLPEAAKLFWLAAVDASCPDRGRFLLRRAEIQEQADYKDLSIETVDQAIDACPELLDGYWLRAQRYHAEGKNDLALEDARRVRDDSPEAKAFHSDLAMEIETERSIREHAQSLILELKEALDIEKGSRPAPDRNRDSALLARQVPIPLTLRYEVTHRVTSPQDFELRWQEFVSYRGSPTDDEYTLIRSLTLPPMEPTLPLYYRLKMANQRLSMRFRINSDGKVSEASWAENGPMRGMRPEMLRPEVDAALKRRRVFDPGEAGSRTPGESWSGHDVRIVDGAPLELTYQSRATRWVEVSGVRSLEIVSEISGEGYSAQETVWLHPQTAVTVKLRRSASYLVKTRSRLVRWQDQVVSHLLAVSGRK